MLATKRPLPPELAALDARIDSMRSRAVRRIHSRPDVAAYVLAQVACAQSAEEAHRLMPLVPQAQHYRDRDRFFALQFGILALGDALPTELFERGVVDDTLGPVHARLGAAALQFLQAYAHLRDTFLTFCWGGYELASVSETEVEFVDSADWPGVRDHAQTVLLQKMEIETLEALKKGIVGPTPGHYVRRLFDLPPALDLGGLPVEVFLTAWIGLLEWCSTDVWSGHCPVVEQHVLAQLLGVRSGIDESHARRFIELLTFDPKGQAGLTLFHCPLLSLSRSTLLVLPGAALLSNVQTNLPRLIVHRGPGLSAYGKMIERHILGRLVEHFKSERVIWRTERRYEGRDDRGDLDLLAYEPAGNRLLVGMLKSFIPPDSAEEVIRANQSLQKGLEQLERARRWLSKLPDGGWASALGLPLRQRPEVHWAVLGDGFAGSDYLEIPEGVSIVNARFLLAPEWRGGSPIDAVAEFNRRLSKEEASIAQGVSRMRQRFSLGRLTITYPSFGLEL